MTNEWASCPECGYRVPGPGKDEQVGDVWKFSCPGCESSYRLTLIKKEEVLKADLEKTEEGRKLLRGEAVHD